MTGRAAPGVRSESSKLHHDQMRPITHDRMRRASDQHSTSLCLSRRLTGRAGSVRDRTRWSHVLFLRTGELTGRAG
jgi:hypothetical protein